MVVAVRYFVVYPFLLQLLKYSGLQFDMPQTVQPATPISSEEHPPMQDERQGRTRSRGFLGREDSQSPGNWGIRNNQVSESEEDMPVIYVRVTLRTMDEEEIGQKTFELGGGNARAHEPSLGAIIAFARTLLPDTTDQHGTLKSNVANVIFSSPGGPIECIVRPHRKIRQFIDDLPTVSCGGGEDTDNLPVFSLVATVLEVEQRAVCEDIISAVVRT